MISASIAFDRIDSRLLRLTPYAGGTSTCLDLQDASLDPRFRPTTFDAQSRMSELANAWFGCTGGTRNAWTVTSASFHPLTSKGLGGHGFRETPGHEDSHGARGDARRLRKTHIDHVAMLRAGRRRSGAGVQADGALDGRDVPTDVHVRSRPPARSGAIAHAGATPGGWALGRATRRWWSIWTPRSARSTASKRARSRVRLHQACSAITRCWPHAPTPVRCWAPACAKAPLDQREAWCASSTSSSPACDAPGPPGRPRCAPTRGSGLDKLIARLDAHNVKWSITVTLGSAVRAAIQAIPDTAWADIDYTENGHAQIAETANTPPAAAPTRAPCASSCAAPASPRAPHSNGCGPTGDTTHSSPTPNTTPPPRTGSTAATPVVELAIRDLKEGAGTRTRPLRALRRALRMARMRSARPQHRPLHQRTLAGAPTATNRTRRTRLVALAAVLVNRSRHTHPAIPRPLGPWANTIPHNTQSPAEPFPAPQADPTPPGTDAPTQTQRRQPLNYPRIPTPTRPNTPPTTPHDPNQQPAGPPTPANSQSVDSGSKGMPPWAAT